MFDHYLRCYWQPKCLKDPVPMHEKLIQTLESVSPNLDVRDQWCLTLLVHLWQVLGPHGPGSPPSLILIRSKEDSALLSRDFLSSACRYFGEEAPQGMGDPTVPAMPVTRPRLLKTFNPNFPDGRKVHRDSGRFARFHGRRNQAGHVKTHWDGHRTFLILDEKDFADFQGELKRPDYSPFRPHALEAPKSRQPAVCPVFGDIPTSLRNKEIAEIALARGHGLVFGMYTESNEIDLKHKEEFQEMLFAIASASRAGEGSICVPTSETLMSTSGFTFWEKPIRYRLRNLPGNYEFFVLQLLRGLQSMALFFIQILPHQQNQMEEVLSLFGRIFCGALAAVLRGLEIFRFHLLDNPYDKTVRRLMDMLRSGNGPMTLRAIQRACPLIQGNVRELLLQDLTDKGLIEVDGKSVKATSLNEFIAGIDRRLSKLLAGQC